MTEKPIGQAAAARFMAIGLVAGIAALAAVGYRAATTGRTVYWIFALLLIGMITTAFALMFALRRKAKESRS